MNMISTGAFQTEMDASNKQQTLAEKFAAIWEKKNAKAARAGGVSLMALSLAACGSSDSSTTTTTTDTTTTDTTTTVTPAAPVAESKTLTTGVDTITTGGADDTINAGLDGANQTLGPLDTIDGGAGTDTLNLALAATTTPSTIQNVETINVTSAAAVTLNMINASGYTSYSNVGSTAKITTTNIDSAGVALTVSNTAADAAFSYGASTLTGTADSVGLTVSQVTGDATVTLTGAIETVNLTSSGAANAIQLDSTATTLNISGSQDVSFVAASTIMDLTTVVDASAATGKVTLTHDHTTAAQGVTITGGSGNDTFTLTGTNAAVDTVSGGAGDDTITFTAELLDTDVVDGGSGTDTLGGGYAELAALTKEAKITNFEGLSSSDAITGALTTATIQAGIDTVTLVAGSNAGTVNFEAGSKALVMGTASAGALTVADTGLAVNDSLAITTSKAANSTNGKDMTINGFETVTLDTSTATAKTIDNITINGDADADGVATAATLTLSGAMSLTHAAGGVVTVGVATAKGTIDASAMTGAYVQTTASVGASTIKGGAGADTLYGSAANATTITGGAGIDTLYGGSAADTISGDDGADIIHGSGGADVLSGGAGKDTFRMDDAELLATATLNGGDGVDTLLIEDLSAVADAQFTLVSSVETLTSHTTGLSATLGAKAMAAGINTVSFGAAGNVAETVTVAKEFTNAITVNLDAYTVAGTGDNAFDASASVAAINFVADAAGDITGAAAAGDLALTGGTTANDKLTTVGGTFVAADLQSIQGVETFIVSNDATASFTLSDANTTATQSLTVDGRAIINTANTFTVVGTAENDGVITVHGSAGADAITGTVTATLGDTIYGYGGADVITINVDGMQTADVIDGGIGKDTLTITGVGTLVDADLTNVTNIEKFTHAGTSTLTTLGTQYMESGSAEITLGAVVNALNLDAITNDQILNIVAGTDTVDASAMTGALNVKFAEASLTTADTLTAGTGTGDTLTITYSGTANVAGDFDNVTGFEKIVAATNAAGGLAIKDSMTAAAASLELDFTALTTTVATVDLALESNAGITLNTGGGDDVITMSISSVGDTISTGAGADGITTAIAQLTASDTVDGGAGTDTLTFSDAGSSADSDFTNVTNIEALTLANGTNTIVLGAEYTESGSVTITGSTGADSITLGSGVTTAQTVALDTAGNDTLVATGATGAITVTMQTDDLTAADTLTGGSGTDILQLQYAANAVTTGEMAGVTKFETIKVADNTASWSVALHDNNTVSGVITVDGALATSNAIVFDGTAEDDGTVNVTGGGGGDTLTGTATTATGDTINGGAGADTITGLAGADTITGGAGADVFTYLAAADSTGTAQDSITDFTSGTDFISVTINNSTNTTGQTYDATIQTAAAGTLAVQAGMSGAIGQTFYDTTNSTLVVNVGGDNLVTTLDYQIGVNAAATAANTVAAGDVRYVITGGTGVDNITTGGGDDTINGGAGNDVIIGGAGADSITAGAGIDTITGGLGADTIVLGAAGDVDTIVMTTGSTAVSVDQVSGFIVAGGEDELQVDLSDLGGTFRLANDSGALAVGATGTLTVTAVASAAADFGAAASSLIAITGATAYTVTSLETAIEGNATGAGTAAGESFLIIYDDTTNSYLAKVTDNAGTLDGANFTDVTITNLLELSGVGAAESFLTTSFAIIA